MIQSFVPEHTPQRLAVKLKAKAESYVRQGHPWVFESSIVKISKEGEAGDIAIVFDQRKNKYIGLGLYDPHSPIRIKMLGHNQSVKIDRDFFIERIASSFDLRESLFATETNGYRLLFGENDGVPGLICDVYAHVAVVKLYSAIWFPYLHWVLDGILESTGCTSIVLRLSRLLQKDNINRNGLNDGDVIYGELPDPEIEFNEYGVRFIANVIKGHETGYFLDHRANRHKVGQMSNGKSVLDVFSYAGGFSTHAIAGGAKEVVSIDISKQAIALAERNVSLNNENAPHKTMAIDAFEGMQQLIGQGEKFDIVVVDPPSFAKNAADIPAAKKSYDRLARLAIQLTAVRGMCIMASCSSRIHKDEFFEMIESAFDNFPRAYRLVEKTYHDIDHPVTFPEGSYLKSGYYKMD